MHVVCYGSVGGVQQILHGVLRDRKFSGWSVVCPSPGDQRHVSAASDPTGRVHIAWREGPAFARPRPDPGRGTRAGQPGPGSGGASTDIAIYYASLDPHGHVEGPIRVSPPGENASTPSIAVSSGVVTIAWVAWAPGTANAEGKRDNGFPSDASSVEGRLEVRARSNNSFGPVAALDAGPVSYPTWACRSDSTPAPDALIWTRNEAGGRNSLLLGRLLSH
jgi:hypothetical protein